MPLLELRILKITVFRTFLLHALKDWAEILHMTLLYCTTDQVRVSSISVNFCGSYAPFGTLEYWKCTVFRTFLLHALTYWAEILHKTLFYFTTDLLRVFLICVNFCRSYAPFGNQNTGNTVSCAYLLCALTYWAEILHMTSFNVLKIKFECHNSVSVWLFVCPSIFCTFLLHALTYLAENLNLTFTWFL